MSVQKLEELDEIMELSRKLDEGGYAKLGGTEQFKADVAVIVLNFKANKSLGVKVSHALLYIRIYNIKLNTSNKHVSQGQNGPNLSVV